MSDSAELTKSTWTRRDDADSLLAAGALFLGAMVQYELNNAQIAVDIR